MSKKAETGFRMKVRRDLLLAQRMGLPLWFESIAQKAICGTPDLILCIAGRFLGLELKAEDGHTSKIQDIKLKAIAQAGGLAIVARPSNWADVLELITDLAKEGKND